MIITVEADGQPFLDSGSVKKIHIPQPEQTCTFIFISRHPPTQPCLCPAFFSVDSSGHTFHHGHFDRGADYASSIASGSDAYSDRTLHSRIVEPHLAPTDNVWWRLLFRSPFSVIKHPSAYPHLNGSTSMEKPTRRSQRGSPSTLPMSWRELSKKYVL